MPSQVLGLCPHCKFFKPPAGDQTVKRRFPLSFQPTRQRNRPVKFIDRWAFSTGNGTSRLGFQLNLSCKHEPEPNRKKSGGVWEEQKRKEKNKSQDSEEQQARPQGFGIRRQTAVKRYLTYPRRGGRRIHC